MLNNINVNANKVKRKCKQCKEWKYLTLSQSKKWRGFCSWKCRREYNWNDKSWLIDQCDSMFSKLVREKGYCERCGTTVMKTDCAHVIPRGNFFLRFDPMNAIDLCHRCHRFWAHSNPLDFTSWFKEKWPARYDYLMHYREHVQKKSVYWLQEVFTKLKSRKVKELMRKYPLDTYVC